MSLFSVHRSHEGQQKAIIKQVTHFDKLSVNQTVTTYKVTSPMTKVTRQTINVVMKTKSPLL